MSKNSLVSIIIVNWNGKNYLQKCLSSLNKITYYPTEIIVVDQNSSDGSQRLVKRKYPKIKLIENKENTGYVGGNNLGVSEAKGKYILILNNDIELEKNFLEPLVRAFEKESKLGVAQPKAVNLREKGKLDGGGSFFTMTGFLYHKGYMDKASKPEYNKRYPVYSVKGAYMMTRSELWNKLGGLDPDFFIYFEESDYCGRVWLSGHTVEYIPESVVYHWGGGDTTEDWERRFALVQYRSFKNRICSYFKNLSFKKLLILLPVHIGICLGVSLFYLLKGQYKFSLAILRALSWNLINLNKTLKKRDYIQSRLRKIDDNDFFKEVEKNIGLSYYFRLVFLLQKK